MKKTCVLVSALLAGSQLFMTALSAKDIPVRPGAEAIALIKRAVDEQANEVVLPRSIFRFQVNERMILSRLENLRIDGAGSTFLFDRGGQFTVNECRDLTVENIIIDYDPLPFTQGLVVGVDTMEKSILVRFEEGFDAPGAPGFPLTVRADGTTRGSVRFLDATGEYMHAMLWEAVTFIRPQSQGEGIYRVGLQHGRLFRPGVGSGSLKAGDRFTLFTSRSEALDVTHCERVVFRNVDIYSAPGFGIGERRGKGGNVYEKCRLIRKPGSGRLMVANRDGFHSYLMEKGPTLKECEISYTADDAIAIHGFFSPVIKAVDSRTVYLLCPFGLNTSKGELLSFYDQEDGRPLGSRVVLDVEKLPAHKGRTELDGWRVALKNAGAQTLRGIPDGEWVVAKVELDEAVELSDFALADSAAFAGAGAQIRDCHIHDTTSRGLLIRSPGTKIIGNRIERTVLAPIALMAERHWLEGPFLSRIEVSGNRIIDAPQPGLDTQHFDYGFAAIQVSSIFGTRSFNPPKFNQHRQNRGIRIIDNHVIRPAGPAIAVFNAEDVVISGNRIESPFAAGISGNPLNLLRTLASSGPAPTPEQSEVAANPWYGIILMAAGNVEVTGNTLVNAEQGMLGPVGVGPWSGDVRLEAHSKED